MPSILGGKRRLSVLIGGLLMAAGLPAAGADSEAAVLCDGLVATIVGGGGNDALPGTAGDDVIHGLQGNDTITSAGGTDVICGGEGNDHIDITGAVRVTRVFGGPGDDVIAGSDEPDELHGGQVTTGSPTAPSTFSSATRSSAMAATTRSRPRCRASTREPATTPSSSRSAVASGSATPRAQGWSTSRPAPQRATATIRSISARHA